MSVNAVSCWTFENEVARLTLSHLRAEIQVARPATGLSRLTLGGTPAGNTSLLCVESSSASVEVVDKYIRGRDLVVRYGQTADQPSSIQVYWRGLSDDDVSWVDQIVSVQTDLLDADPKIVVRNQMPSESSVAPGFRNNATLVRPHDLSCSWLLLAHPRDCDALEIEEAEDSLNASFRMFYPGLEKGVIRRARFRAALLPRENDVVIAQQCIDSFLQQELPLTA